MRNRTRIRSFGAHFVASGVALAVFTHSAAAHHARPDYDQSAQISVTGTVKEFRFVNPHAWIDIAVETDDGGSEDWSFEGDSVARLVRAGWNGELLQPGDVVTVIFSPRRDGAPGGIFRGVTAADGKFYSASRGRINVRFGSGRP